MTAASPNQTEPEESEGDRLGDLLRARAENRARVYAVGGGKGGIGKSFVTASLSIALAQRGKRVVALDADLGGANLHTCLGLTPPRLSVSDLLNERVARINDLVVPTPVKNLGLIAGALDALDVANPRLTQKLKLIRSLQELDADYVLLDLGAGTSFNVLDFFLIADQGLLVIVPEPTSVENTYRFIKAAFFRRLSSVLSLYGIARLVEEAIARRDKDGTRTPSDLLEAVKRRDPEAGANLEREMRRFRPAVIVNQARGDNDRLLGEAVVMAWRRHFGLEMDYLGAIGYDDEVWRAVRQRQPVLVSQPHSQAAQSVGAVADLLLSGRV